MEQRDLQLFKRSIDAKLIKAHERLKLTFNSSGYKYRQSASQRYIVWVDGKGFITLLMVRVIERLVVYRPGVNGIVKYGGRDIKTLAALKEKYGEVFVYITDRNSSDVYYAWISSEVLNKGFHIIDLFTNVDKLKNTITGRFTGKHPTEVQSQMISPGPYQSV